MDFFSCVARSHSENSAPSPSADSQRDATTRAGTNASSYHVAAVVRRGSWLMIVVVSWSWNASSPVAREPPRSLARWPLSLHPLSIAQAVRCACAHPAPKMAPAAAGATTSDEPCSSMPVQAESGSTLDPAAAHLRRADPLCAASYGGRSSPLHQHSTQPRPAGVESPRPSAVAPTPASSSRHPPEDAVLVIPDLWDGCNSHASGNSPAQN